MSTLLPTAPITRAYVTHLGTTYEVPLPPTFLDSLGHTEAGRLNALAMIRSDVASLYERWGKGTVPVEVEFDYEREARAEAELERLFKDEADRAFSLGVQFKLNTLIKGDLSQDEDEEAGFHERP